MNKVEISRSVYNSIMEILIPLIAQTKKYNNFPDEIRQIVPEKNFAIILNMVEEHMDIPDYYGYAINDLEDADWKIKSGEEVHVLSLVDDEDKFQVFCASGDKSFSTFEKVKSLFKLKNGRVEI